MSDPGFLKCPCQKCGSRIEFPVQGVGVLIDCPHCGQKTVLHRPASATVPISARQSSPAPLGIPVEETTVPVREPATPPATVLAVSVPPGTTPLPTVAARSAPDVARPAPRATTTPPGLAAKAAEPIAPSPSREKTESAPSTNAETNAAPSTSDEDRAAPPARRSPLVAVILAVMAVLALGGGGVWYLNWRESQAEKQTLPGSRPAAGKTPRKKSANAEVTTPTNKNVPKPKEESRPAFPEGPKSLSDLQTGSVIFEKASGSSLVYAVGTLTNASVHERYGVRIEVELTDAAGQSAGVAKDYRPLLGPGETWRFRALLLDSRARQGKVKTITEDP